MGVSSTAPPITAQQQGIRQRNVPPLPSTSAARVGSPPARALPLSKREGITPERDMRLGIQALRASQERIGVQCETSTPPLASASTTPMWSCQSLMAETDKQITSEAEAVARGCTTAGAASPGITCLESMHGHTTKSAEQALALGGHASVADLIYERDCLAAALGAEQRRASEFQQLWHRAEEAQHRAERELQQLRNAGSSESTTEKDGTTALASMTSAQLHATIASVLKEQLNSFGLQSNLPCKASEESLRQTAICPENEVPASSHSGPRPFAFPEMTPSIADSGSMARWSQNAQNPSANVLTDSTVPRPVVAEPIPKAFEAYADAIVQGPTKAFEAYADAIVQGPEMTRCEASSTISSQRPSTGDGGSGHIDELCREFRLQVRDMVAATVGGPYSKPEAKEKFSSMS